MTIAKGIAKQLIYKKETTFGTLAGASSAQRLRRTESTLNLQKDTYQSAEIRSDYQIADFRHGVRRVAGNVNGELSLGTYKDFIAHVLRQDWVAGVSKTNSDFTSVTSDSGTKTFTFASGNPITEGFRVGDVIRWTGLAATANNSRNMRITALTSTAITVAESITTDASPDSSFTVAVVGSKVMVPSTGHTDTSFTFEHYFSDLDKTEVFTGVKVNTMEIGLPATGMATINMAMMGQNRTLDPNGDGSAPYFTSPTSETTTAILAAVSGVLRVNGADNAVVTGITINISGNITGDPVVGSNLIPNMFTGRVNVTGSFTAYFDGQSLDEAFDDESEVSLHFMLTTADGEPKPFLAVHLPRIKLGGNDKNDGEGGLIQTIPFQALLKPTTSGFDSSTIIFQDSSVS
jgi:hypothetical protein